MPRRKEATHPAPGHGDGPRSGAPSRLAAIAVLALAAVFAFRRIDDFDTWWHRAAGRWIVQHGAIPRADVLSHTVRGHPWTNLEWAFEAGIYLLNALG